MAYKEKHGKKADKQSEFFKKRKLQLMSFRQATRETDLEGLMRQADRDVALKPLNPGKQRGLSYGENWRLVDGQVTMVQDDTWRSDNSDAVVFSKLQTALSLMFDRNPSPILTPKSKRYVATTEIAKAILEDSQYKEDFKDKAKLFVFNTAKYGWGFGRTFVCEYEREFEDLTAVNPVTGEKHYETKKEVTRQVKFKPLSNWNVWVDEEALPYQEESINDWMWRETYSDDEVFSEFGDSEEVKAAVKKKGQDTSKNKDQDSNTAQSTDSDTDRTDLNELYFYENRYLDLVYVECNGEKVYSEHLPAHKKLSLIYAMWNLRSDSSIYGVGLPEIMRQDKNLLDKIRNMSVDQLVLSIYKMFFYDGTADGDDVALKISPGRGQKLYDPSKLRWLEVPSGGAEAYQREELLRGNLDESTGISKALSGTVNENPNIKALALQQAKESALSKLKVPLDNILSALRNEAKIRWALIQELNMFPIEVEKLVNPAKVEAYLQEIEFNQELFHLDREEMAVYALKFPEISAKVKLGEDGVYRPSQERSFFTVTPELIRWQGDIVFDAEAILVVNKELSKQMDLEMANMLIPLFQGPPELNLKPCRQILRIYSKDEEDWLPDFWLHPQAAPAPMMQTAGQIPQQEKPGPKMNTVIPAREAEAGRGTTNVIDKMTARNMLE